MLLSLVLPSCMVAPIRELANIQLSISILNPILSNHQPVLNIDKNNNMTSIRRRTPVGLKNNSRDLSIISVISSKFYFEQMEDQNHNTSWFNQVEDKCNHLSLNTNVEKSNISNGSTSGNNSKDKQHASNKALALNNTCSPHVESIDNFQHAL